MSIPIIGDIIDLIKTIVNWILTTIQKVLDTIQQAINPIIAYLQLLFQGLPFDKPKSPIMMSLIWLVFILAVIMFFGNWAGGGVKAIDNNAIGWEIDLQALGNSSINADGETGTTLIRPPTPNLNASCVSDDDCITYEEGIAVKSTSCCLKEKYEAYSCSGHCLKKENIDLEACKHPNACEYYPVSFDEHAGADSNRCDKTINPNGFCRTKTASVLTHCVIDEIAPCFGYCTIPERSQNDYDITACYEQGDAIVIQNTPGGKI